MRLTPVTGTLDLTPRKPVVVHSGTVSMREYALDGRDWEPAPPAWRPPADASGFGHSNEGGTVARGLPLSRILALLLQPPLSVWMSSEGPLCWQRELLGFQKVGVAALIEHTSMLLADDMGLGKTIQAVAAMRLLVRRAEAERILVVAPAAVTRNWREELRTWAPELRTIEVTGTAAQRVWKWDARVHVKIVSYETLRSDSQRAIKRHGEWDIVCLDEAQRIKNSESAISGVVKSIKCRRRWALTGTPLENSLDDVRSILSFLQPGEMEARRGGDLDVNALGSALRRVQLRRKKSEALPDLPPKTIKEVFVPLTGRQRDEYDALIGKGVEELRGKGSDATVTDVLALITRLKQVCNFSLASGRSSKLDDMAPRLAVLRDEGHKALIFSQFTNESYGVRRIARALEEFRPVIYTGDMTAEQRRQALDAFRSDPEAAALILSLKAGGVGLNLQAASYVFHFDRWWNPASEAQAEDRSHRIGQTRGVSVYKYICEDTIEERIHEILLAKRALFAEHVDDVCLDLGQRLSDDDLFGLFGLRPPPSRAGQLPKREDDAPAVTDVEAMVRMRLAEEGYNVEVRAEAAEDVIDLVAVRTDELGMETALMVRCVARSGPADAGVIEDLSDLLPVEQTSVRGMVACSAGFTDSAARLARRHHISLWTPE
ncbi:MAG: SNF2-related protein [Armatimonadota bacterium]|nr:SNF2-related protein [Armatimonadota bacterium]